MKKVAQGYGAVYIRKSKQDKGQDTLSPAQQREDGKEAVEAAGYPVPEKFIFEDINVSGKYPPRQFAESPRQKTRPDATRLIEAIESGEVKVVGIRMANRLWGTLLQQQQFVALFKKHGVRIIATHDPAMPKDMDGSGKFILDILGAVAEQRLTEMSAQARATKKTARSRGLKLCPVKLLGYLDIPQGVKPDPKTIPVVEEIFRRFTAGESTGKITHWLERNHPRESLLSHMGRTGDDGVWYRRSGTTGPWNETTVKRTLRNPRYIGMEQAGGKLVVSKHYPAIITPELYWLAQRVIEARAGSRRPPAEAFDVRSHAKKIGEVQKKVTVEGYRKSPIPQPHLLSGILTCGTHNHRPLACHRRAHDLAHFYKCNGEHEVSQLTLLEDVWIEWARSFFTSGWVKQAVSNAEEAALRVRADWADGEIEALKKRLKARSIDADTFADGMAIVKSEKEDAEAALRALPPALRSPIKPWEDMTFDERRETLRYMLDRVEVFQDHCIVKFQPHTGRDPMLFPFMQRKADKRQVRPSNCLTPKLLTSAEAVRVMHIGSGAHGKTGIDHIDWKAHLKEGIFRHINPDHANACRNCQRHFPAEIPKNAGDRLRTKQTVRA